MFHLIQMIQRKFIIIFNWNIMMIMKYYFGFGYFVLELSFNELKKYNFLKIKKIFSIKNK